MPRYVIGRLPLEANGEPPRIMGWLDVTDFDLRKTGLVNQHGQEIYRAPNTIGFQAKHE